MRLANKASAVEASSAPVDWPELKASILAGLDVAAEFEALGVVFSAAEPNAKGIRACHALGRVDEVPSAFVAIGSGVYHDSGGSGSTLHLFDAALQWGSFGRWLDVVRYYAAKAGVDVSWLRAGKGGRIREATYLYRRGDGSTAYAVFRYRLPSGKKAFSQHPPDGRGGWVYGAGCMDGVEPLPYRLPELLASDMDEPVWVVEGERDADRLASLGLIATTNHQGAGSTGLWARLVRHFAGRTVHVLPDNDPAGMKHATGVAGWLDPVVKQVKVVSLPGVGSKGDVSDWLDQGGDLETLHQLADAAPVWTEMVFTIEASIPSSPGPAIEASIPPTPTLVQSYESEGDPHRLARLYRDARCQHAGRTTLRYWRGEWHRWDGAAYRPVADRELRAEISATTKEEFDRLATEAVLAWESRGQADARGKPANRPEAAKVTTQLLANVASALSGYTLLPGVVESPAWLDGDGPTVPPREILPAKNGLVHLPTLLARGTDAILPPTPRYFVPWALDYSVDTAAPSPAEWLAFLADLWPDDFEAITTLQEWFGYVISQDTKFQKMLGLIGPPRSGKGTIGRVLQSLIGRDNSVGPTLSSLASQFGLESLIGRPLAVIDDARLSWRSDVAVIVERLLTITGEGTLTVDRKFQPAWTGRLPTRIVLISNELPKLSDTSDALVSRFILLELTESWRGREDLTLGDRLVANELPGILLWAVEGLRRLRERGRFVMPQSSKDLLGSLEDLTSPLGAFVNERCEIGPGQEVLADDFYAAWKGWCEAAGRKGAGSIQDFARDLHAAVPGLTTVQRRANNLRRSYVGIGLRAVEPVVPERVRKLIAWFPDWLDSNPGRWVAGAIRDAGAAGLLERKSGSYGEGFHAGPLFEAAASLGWASMSDGGGAYWGLKPVRSEHDPY